MTEGSLALAKVISLFMLIAAVIFRELEWYFLLHGLKD